MPTGIYTRKRKPIQERFENLFYMEPISGCWLWTGTTIGKGYGVFRTIPTIKTVAHRVAWQLYRGPIPNGMWVLHKCDTPSCVNPLHLFLGNRNDNSKDMVIKGRSLRGERSIHAKLTSGQIFKIREDMRPGEIISKEYGVTGRTINHIRSRETWKHLIFHSSSGLP